MSAYKKIIIIVTYILSLTLSIEVYQYPKSKDFEEFFQRRSRNQKFIDIYTNHPDEKEVVRNYFEVSSDNNRRDSSTGRFYKKMNHTFKNDYEKDPFYYDYNGHRYGQKHSNMDELHSDFGLFDGDGNKNQISQEDFLAILNHKYANRNNSLAFNDLNIVDLPSFVVRKRPKFKTKYHSMLITFFCCKV